MFDVTDGLTVFQPQLGHLLRPDPVSRDLCKEDGIYSDHGDRWSPALFDGDKVGVVSHCSCPLEVMSREKATHVIRPCSGEAFTTKSFKSGC